MKTKLMIVTLMAVTSAHAGEVGIASGSKTGTIYPMVENIVQTCSNNSTKYNNVITEGALENVEQVYSNPKSQFGVAYVDSLFYQQGIDPKMMDRIKMVFPFYSADFHIIKKKGSKISSLADLQGKRVVEGPQGSGTWVSTQVLKQLTGLDWKPIYASQKAGLDQVLSGQADAEVIVAGKPVTMLENLPEGVELINISHPKLDSFNLYTKTMIPNGMYPFQRGSVQTYKVDSALITYAYQNQYQKEIAELVTCITKNIHTLQTNGHAKWRDVDPTDINRIKWPSHPAAVNAIKKASK